MSNILLRQMWLGRLPGFDDTVSVFDASDLGSRADLGAWKTSTSGRLRNELDDFLHDRSGAVGFRCVNGGGGDLDEAHRRAIQAGGTRTRTGRRLREPGRGGQESGSQTPYLGN